MLLRFPYWVSYDKEVVLTVSLIYTDKNESGDNQRFVIQLDDHQYDMLRHVVYDEKHYDRELSLYDPVHYTDWFNFKDYTKAIEDLEEDRERRQDPRYYSCHFLDRFEIGNFEIIQEDNAYAATSLPSVDFYE